MLSPLDLEGFHTAKLTGKTLNFVFRYSIFVLGYCPNTAEQLDRMIGKLKLCLCKLCDDINPTSHKVNKSSLV